MNEQILLEALRKKQRWFVENKMQAMLEHRECEELALHTLNFTRDDVWEVTIGNMRRVIYVFEVQTAGSIDSLVLNLIKSKK